MKLDNKTSNEFRDLLVSIGPLGWGRRVPDVGFRLTLETTIVFEGLLKRNARFSTFDLDFRFLLTYVFWGTPQAKRSLFDFLSHLAF